MTDTRQKLLEAKYFLGRMIENQAERDAFKYNLSAFLAAFRSVTRIMKKEFDKIPGFTEWYSKREEEMETNARMKLLKDKRNITVHQQPVQPSAHVNVGLGGTVTLTSSLSATIIRAGGTVEQHNLKSPKLPPTPAKMETPIQWRWYFSEITDIDVVAVCQECMTKLEAMVAKCEQRFSSLVEGEYNCTRQK